VEAAQAAGNITVLLIRPLKTQLEVFQAPHNGLRDWVAAFARGERSMQRVPRVPGLATTGLPPGWLAWGWDQTWGRVRGFARSNPQALPVLLASGVALPLMLGALLLSIGATLARERRGGS
jgi:hypothetical protein